MYYQHHHQGQNTLSSLRMSIPSERHLSLRRGSGPEDSGLILSTDAKPRLKWTPDLHERFIKAVNQLGGADKATPKTIMKVMGIPGLTLYHLKSHLQKYRLSKNLNGQSNSGSNKMGLMDMIEEKSSDASETHSTGFSIGPERNKNQPMNEALHMQIEVQRRLHEQLEVQRHLQLRIEAQGKYLHAVLEKAQATIGRQNLGTEGVEAAKVQLSELASKVSEEYSSTAFLDHKESRSLQADQMLTMARCPEGTQANSRMLENGLGLRPYLGDSMSEQRENMEESLFPRMELTWAGGIGQNRNYVSTVVDESEMRRSSSERSPENLSIGVGLHGQREHGNAEERTGEKNEDYKHETQEQKGMNSIVRLDLNMHDENYGPKQLDLNGFSWN